MNIYTFKLLGQKGCDQAASVVTFYILDHNECGSRGLVIVCPGGAYSNLSAEREGSRVATAYLAAGFNAAVLKYAVYPETHPRPLLDLAQAVRLARRNAAQWQTDPHRIAVCGFSAGGHLAASLCNLWDDPAYFSPEEIGAQAVRPDAAVLCYPVIAPLGSAAKQTFANLTGKQTSDSLWSELSLQRRVTAATPPTFLFHTWEDQAVSVKNTLDYAQALQRAGVAAEVHIFTRGMHGIDLAASEPARLKPRFGREYPWLKLSAEWLYERFDLQ